MNCQNHNQRQKRQHHPLADALQSLLKAEGAHQKARQHNDHHEDGHLAGIGQHRGEHAVHSIGGSAVEGADGKLIEIIQHPAGDCGVVHHQKAAANDAEPAVNMPLAALGLQSLVPQYRALAAGTSHGQLHGQYGHSHDHQEQHIEQNKYAAAVFAGHIGELPHIADADGAAGAHQQEA